MNRILESANTPHSQARYILVLAIILLAAFSLRIWLLGNQNIWWDEGLAIWAVRQGWAQMTLWTASDVHPPVYFWLLWAWVRLAGESEFSARFLSLICGMVTIAALYPLGKFLLGRKVALGSVALLALSRFHIWWSQEMRMYIVATMWGVLSLYTLLRWLQAEGLLGSEKPAEHQRQPMLEGFCYVFTTASGLYTLYLFVSVILIENVFVLYLLFRQTGKNRLFFLSRWLLMQLAILGLFIPWLALALPRMRSWSVATPFNFWVFIQLYATLLTLGISTYVERYTWLVAPFFLIIAVAQLLLRRLPAQEETSKRLIAIAPVAFLLFLFLLIPSLIVYAVTLPRGLFYTPRIEARYLVLFAPAFYLLLSWSLSTLYRQIRWVGVGALVFVTAMFIWTLPGHYVGRYLRDEHQTMVRIIAAYAQPNDAVLLVSGSRYPIFGYYYERLPAGNIRPPVYPLPQQALQINRDNVEQELAPLAASHSRLWLAQVNAPMEDPENLVRDWLDQRYSRILSFGFGHNALILFAPSGTVAEVNLGNLAPQHSLSAPLGEGATLLGYDLPTQQFRPQDMVHLALYYTSDSGMTISVRMVDSQGRILVQHEINLPPAQPVGRQQVDVNIYAYTPPGLYHFEVEGQGTVQHPPVSFGELRVAATKPLPKAGSAPVALFAQLEDGIELLGYGLTDFSGRSVHVLHPGDTVVLDLYWRCRHKTAHNYTIFTHLVGQAYNPATEGPVWAGHDSQPLEEGYPTMQWFVNEIIVDRHLLTLDAQAPAGDYELEVGMYLLETMTRLSVLDAQGQVVGDRVVLGHFQVVSP
nr:glycosyltransferase family 39 protein [Chloroflexota bacterium]